MHQEQNWTCRLKGFRNL